MKRHCIIDIPDVKSKKAFMNELQVMLDDYGDMNEDAKDIKIQVRDITKGLFNFDSSSVNAFHHSRFK